MDEQPKPALRTEQLTYMAGETAILRDLTVSFEGPRAVLFGPSGSGKTSLLRLLAGLERPSAGRVFSGQALWSEPGRVLIAPERRKIGFVFQNLGLWPSMTVAQTLEFVIPKRGDERRQAAESWAERVGLGARLRQRAADLSGGEKQRLAVARALAQEPDCVFFDEPFAQLDRPERRAMLLQVLDWLEQCPGLRAVLVTHQLDEAELFADELVLMDQGRVLTQGSLRALRAEPGRARVAEMLALGAVLPARVEAGGVALGWGRLAVKNLEESWKSEDRVWVLLRPRDCLLKGSSGADEGAWPVTVLGSEAGGRVWHCQLGDQPGNQRLLAVLDEAVSPDSLFRGARAGLVISEDLRLFRE